jgi:protein translocase SecG subunit
MIFLNTLWLIINILLILLILVRSPNEQSLQERLGPLKLFDSYGSTEKNLDKIIKFLIFSYFFIGFLLTSKV